MKTKIAHHHGDRILFVLIIILVTVGILMVYNSSIVIAVRDFADPYYYVKEQSRGVILGIVLLLLCSFIDYRFFKKYALLLYTGTLLLLFFVFIPGIGVEAMGARRWIRLFGIVIQPAEIMKFSSIVYLSVLLSKDQSHSLISFIVFVVLTVSLIIIEPDMGTSMIIMGIATLMYFASGSHVLHMLILIPVVVFALSLVAVVSPYRMARLLTFIHPQDDPLGSSYQMNQALIAIGSGGFSGVGLGMSRQKYEYLPEANTDSIFAVIAEETGFLGAGSMILLYYFIVRRGFMISSRSDDAFGRLFAAGLSGWVAIQSILNMSAMMALVPLTGIPLPFLSYGSSSLVILLIAYGVLINISKQTKT